MKTVSSQLHISLNLADKIEQVVGGYEFPWVWRSSSKYGRDMAGVISKDFQFIHTIYANNEQKSEVFELVKPLLDEFEYKTALPIKAIHRIKANLLPKQILDEEGLAETIHIDVDKGDKKYLTIVYYVSDSDGDTVIYDKGEVVFKASPVKGMAVYFPSHMEHRATPPVNNKRRIVLNIIVEI